MHTEEEDNSETDSRYSHWFKSVVMPTEFEKSNVNKI